MYMYAFNGYRRVSLRSMGIVVDHNAFNWTSLIINTPTQQAPYTGDRARCAASTAPNTRGGTRESTAACGRRPGPQRSCRCSRSGDRHCETGSRGTNRHAGKWCVRMHEISGQEWPWLLELDGVQSKCVCVHGQHLRIYTFFLCI